jgi:hypothetical protein
MGEVNMIAANGKVEHRDLQEKKAIDEARGAVFTDWQTEENLSKFD